MSKRNAIWLVAAVALASALWLSATLAQPAETVTVTAYFGPQSKATHEKTIAFEKGDTAISATLRAARVETNPTRTFIQSIEGVGNNQERKEYWLFFVNGEAMHVGAAETPLSPGDRVLWFLRRQGAAAHVHEK